MSSINFEIERLLRDEFTKRQTNRLQKIESERMLEQRLGVSRQRIRTVVNRLISEGLLVKQEGKGTYIAPLVKNRFLNLICSPDIKFNDPFYNNLLVELTNFAAKENVNIIPLNMETYENGAIDSPILMVGRFAEEDLCALKKVFTRMVSFENYQNHDDFSQIYFDHYRIGYNAAKVLSEYGHKKVIHLTGVNKYTSSSLRCDGFLKCARKQNMSCRVVSDRMNFQGGYNKGRLIMNLIEDQGYTAVFVVNDWMAVGLIQYMKENGLKIPEQLSVISVDNISLAGQITPGITTYSLDMKLMVAELFSLLNDLSTGDFENNSVNKRVQLAPVLIARESLRFL